MKYGLLKQQNADYNLPLWSELSDLYKGGYQVGKNAEQYIPRLPRENPQRYKARCECAAYLPYLSEIVDNFISILFSQDLTIAEAVDADNPDTSGTIPDPGIYDVFAKNADMKGKPLTRLLRGAISNALVKGKAIVALDFPKPAPDQAAPANRAEEANAGLDRPYAEELEIEQLIDWEYSDDIVVNSATVGHTFSWAVLYRVTQRRNSPEEARGARRHEFRVWRMDPSGVAVWQLYALTESPNQQIVDDTDFPLVDFGITTFKQIPLMEIAIPEGLWLGGKLGCVAKEHWRRRSSLVMSEEESLMAILVLKKGPEMSAPGNDIPSEAQQNPNRGATAPGRTVEIGSGDDLGYAEPSGAAFTIVDSQLKDLKDEMFRVAHQMAASVDNKSSTMRRSGESKNSDKDDIAIIVEELAKYVRDWALRIFTAISIARGEDIVWTPRGLDKYQADDRAEVLAEAVQVDMVSIPSKTFKQEYKTQIAMKLLPNAAPQTQDVIRAEIVAGVSSEETMRLQVKEAEADAVINPPPPAPIVSPPANGNQNKPPAKAS